MSDLTDIRNAALRAARIREFDRLSGNDAAWQRRCGEVSRGINTTPPKKP